MQPAVQIIGRSSSHFTRVAALFAHELSVQFELVPVPDLTTLDASAYAGNPVLKMPTLRTPTSLVFGTENICRALTSLAPSRLHIVWPEQLDDQARNAQELVWHCMAAQVQLILGTMLGKLPKENVYFAKGHAGFVGALNWLDENLARTLSTLPARRDLSLFEVTLFCLMEHLKFRGNLSVEPYPALTEFATAFAKRRSAQQTQYRFDSAQPALSAQPGEQSSPTEPGDAGDVLIIHVVKEYASWKRVFDDAAGIRKQAGELSYRVLRDAGDPNNIVHFSSWSSLERARAFFESAELVEIRRNAGVEAPKFHYLQGLERGTL